MKKLLPLLVLLLAAVMVVAGCAGGTTSGTGTTSGATTSPAGGTGGTGGTSSSGASGTLVVNATDAPPSHNVTAIIVTVSSVRVHKAGPGEDTATPTDNGTGTTMTSENGTGSGSSSGAGGQWIDIPLSDNATTFDLLQVQGILHNLGSANLTAGTYTQIRLQVSGVKVGLNGGTPQAATLPSGVLKVVRPFQVAADLTTSLTLDFAADQMVTVTGNGEIIVKPVVKLTISKPSPSGKPTQAGPSGGLTTRPTGNTNTPTSASGNETAKNGKPSTVPTPNNK